jgi:hypothetical protein
MSKAVFLKHVNIGIVKIKFYKMPLFIQINLEKSKIFRK